MIALGESGAATTPSQETDRVVLLDEAHAPVGTAPRLAVHTTDTPLHRAFSCYVFDERGRVLITRRALTKVAWPGVWTNACCGHPRPDEADAVAIARRASDELGIAVADVRPLLPGFRYRAVDASGIVENEVCPVYAARLASDDMHPDPDEVMDWAWVEWDELSAAIAATPAVYSPWSVLQMRELGGVSPWGTQHAGGEQSAGSAASPGDLVGFLDAVEDELRNQVAGLSTRWGADAGTVGLDVLEADLPDMLSARLMGQGKRFRAAMVWWGFLAGGGAGRGRAQLEDAVRIAAAIEMLHLFGLVHDDVMDESTLRRGTASVHVAAAREHRDAGALGDGELFGSNIAVLLGDLAHMLADQMVAGLPSPLQHSWYRMCTELMVGQRADLTGSAAGRRDSRQATQVARLKSGRYTIDRPLEMGALAAGAGGGVLDVLRRFAEHMGTAFALRDDVLGVWGDPAVTGKPASDDLVEGKATVVLSLAAEVLQGPDAELLARVGSGCFTREDAALLAQAMERGGVRSHVEELIRAEHDRAVAVLGHPLDEESISGLTEAAALIAWRAR